MVLYKDIHLLITYTGCVCTVSKTLQLDLAFLRIGLKNCNFQGKVLNLILPN